VGVVEEAVVANNTVLNTWTATESPAHDGINNGVDTPNDAQYLRCTTHSKLNTSGYAEPVGTGYDRINAVKLRIRFEGTPGVNNPGAIISLYNDGNLLGSFQVAMNTSGIKQVGYVTVTGLDIAPADADKFTRLIVSATDAGYDDIPQE
jgi:hypothetical protein